MSNVKSLVKKLVKAIRLYDLLYKPVNDYRQRKRRTQFHKNGQECLARVKKAFDSIDRLFWLDFGTLLGAIRENDFIEHDLDLDIGTFYEENGEKLEKALLQQGLKKIKEFSIDGKVFEQTYSYNGADIDVFYYFKDDSQMWCYFFHSNNEIKPEIVNGVHVYKGWDVSKAIDTYTGFRKHTFKGMEFDVPKDTHLYLTENYGTTYMIKQKEWDYKSSPTNIERTNLNNGTGHWYSM